MNKHLKNISILTLSQIISKASHLVFYGLLLLLFKPSNLAIFFLCLTPVTLSRSIISGLCEGTLIRFIPEVKQFSRVFTFWSVVSIGTSFLLCLILFFVQKYYPVISPYMLYIYILILIAGFNIPFGALLKGLRKYKESAGIEVIRNTLQPILLIIFYYFFHLTTYPILFKVLIFSSFFSLLCTLFFLPSIKFKFTIPWDTIHYAIGNLISKHLMAWSLATDTIIMYYLHFPYDLIGIWSILKKFYTGANHLAVIPVQTVIIPEYAASKKKKHIILGLILQLLMSFILSLGVSGVFLIYFLLTGRLKLGALMLILFPILTIIHALSNGVANYFRVKKKMYDLAKLSAALLIIEIIFAWILGSWLGILGLFISLIGVELGVCIWLMLFNRDVRHFFLH